MTPVTSGVSHREENGHVPATCLIESVAAPFPPVDRIVLVLEEIGGGGSSETVGHTSSMLRCPPRVDRGGEMRVEFLGAYL
jgi:hypothetical protein